MAVGIHSMYLTNRLIQYMHSIDKNVKNNYDIAICVFKCSMTCLYCVGDFDTDSEHVTRYYAIRKKRVYLTSLDVF